MYKLTFLLILPFVVGQQLVDRLCEDYPITTQQNFAIDKYLGRWHELMRYETSMQMNGDCVTATYELNDNGTVKLVNQMKRDGEIFSIEGYATEQNPELHDGKLVIKIPNSQGNYWILQTDYDNYSVVWSCYNNSGKSRQFLWILARKTYINDAVIQNILSVINKNELDSSLLKPTYNDIDYCGF